jgi:hypothetical protein
MAPSTDTPAPKASPEDLWADRLNGLMLTLLGVAFLAGLAFFGWFKIAGPGRGNTDQDVFPWASAPLAFAAMVSLFMIVRGARHLYRSFRA